MFWECRWDLAQTGAFDTSEGPTPPGRLAPKSAKENFPPIPSSSHATHISTTPALNQLVPYRSCQSLNVVEGDTESVPHFTVAEKAKRKANSNVLMLGDEIMPGEPGLISNEDETDTGCTTPTPRAVAEVTLFTNKWKFCSDMPSDSRTVLRRSLTYSIYVILFERARRKWLR